MTNLLITFLVIIILILFNALYVLSEFSAVSARKARISQMAEEGNPSAKFILGIIENPHKLDAYVATSQVGITLSSLILGFYGQSQLSPYLEPVLDKIGIFPEGTANTLSASLILVVLTLFQVLFGELIPKNLGIQEPEQFAIFTARPLQWSGWVFKPLISLFNGSGIALMKLLKINPSTEHTHIHSPQEIELLIQESGEGGVISLEEYRLLTNTLRMRESMVKHIMIPRSQMTAAPGSISLAELTKRVSVSPYSRLPIYQDSIDNIVGIVHLRELFCWQNQHPEDNAPIEQFTHPVLFVPETMQVKRVFSLLQKKQLQIAIVLDEYGGTLGMVTIEDLVEEIFGDLHDEFDQDLPIFQLLEGNTLLIRGNTPIQDINEILGLHLPNQEVDTIAGLLISHIGRIPRLHEQIEIGTFQFNVEKMRGRAITQIGMPITPLMAEKIKDVQL